MSLMSKVTKKSPPTPSSTAYKDVSKKFNASHEIKSFLDTLYTHLCAEYPCAEALGSTSRLLVFSRTTILT